MNETKQSTPDVAILDQLNKDYVHSDQFNDVKRFSELLADDFIAQTPGVSRNRAEFLEFIAKPRPFKDLAVHDVKIRILDDEVSRPARSLRAPEPTTRARLLVARPGHEWVKI